MADDQVLFELPTNAVQTPAKKAPRKSAPKLAKARKPSDKRFIGPPIARPATDPALAVKLRQIREEASEKIAEGGYKALNSHLRGAHVIEPIEKFIRDALGAAVSRDTWAKTQKKIQTKWGQKKQDVLVIPGGENSGTGASTLSTSLKGHFWGEGRNLGNHFSSVRAELLDLHETHPRMVCGNVQVVALNQIDPKAAQNGELRWIRLTKANVEKVLNYYTTINSRQDPGDGDNPQVDPNPAAHVAYAERVAIMFVDFSYEEPLLYQTVDELRHDGWVYANCRKSLMGATIDGFVTDVLAEHGDRWHGDSHTLIR